MLTRQDPKPPASADAIDPEVPSVRRKDQVRVQLFGKSYESRVGVVHWKVRVLFEQLPASTQRAERERNENGATLEKEIEAGLLSSPDSAEQVSGLRQDGFRANDGPAPRVEEATELAVKSLRSVEKRYERSRIQEQLTGHSSATQERIAGGSPRDPELRTREIR